MAIKEENLIPVEGIIKAGQRLVKIGETFVPVGFGGAFEPGAISYKEEGRDTYYKCASVGETTWDGYALVLGDDGCYTISETLATGLSYGRGYKPKVGNIYNADATIDVSKYWHGVVIPTDGLILHMTMENQGSLTANNTDMFVKDGNIPYAHFDNSDEWDNDTIKGTLAGFPQGNNPFSISMYVRNLNTDLSYYSTASFINIGSIPYSNTIVSIGNIGTNYLQVDDWTGSSKLNSTKEVTNNSNWLHVCFVFDGSLGSLYLDGVLDNSTEMSFNIGGTDIGIGCLFWGNTRFVGDVSITRVYNRALSMQEVVYLSKELYIL